MNHETNLFKPIPKPARTWPRSSWIAAECARAALVNSIEMRNRAIAAGNAQVAGQIAEQAVTDSRHYTTARERYERLVETAHKKRA